MPRFPCYHHSPAILAFVIAGLLAAQSRPQAPTAEMRRDFLKTFVAAAIERTHHTVRYDPAYVRLAYPGGDVPPDTGVCTDEVIRAYRAVGIDLQKEVHEDMTANFSSYPSELRRGRTKPDANIDHRRVPNLMVFFTRKGQVLPITRRAEDFQPGDLVTWDLGGNMTHIGIVVDQKAPLGRRYMIVHNIGQGPKMEDVLFDWKIIGHYRYFGTIGQPANPSQPSHDGKDDHSQALSFETSRCPRKWLFDVATNVFPLARPCFESSNLISLAAQASFFSLLPEPTSCSQ